MTDSSRLDPAYGQDSDSASSHEHDGGEGTASLHPDLWRAMVSETPGAGWYMDRDTLVALRVPHSDGEPLSPVADEPDRYLEVPTLPTERQRSHARSVLADIVGPDQARFLTSEEPWLRHFHEHATPELRNALSDARRAWVIGEVRTWLHNHDLPEHRFVRVNRPSPRDPRRLGRTRISVLRDALHRAIDRMSERELEALPVPARLLLDD